jgi:hypothetical protein
LRKTKVVVVDGADGMTPDMLRKQKRKSEFFGDRGVEAAMGLEPAIPPTVEFLPLSNEQLVDYYGKWPLQEYPEWEPVERIRGQFE